MINKKIEASLLSLRASGFSRPEQFYLDEIKKATPEEAAEIYYYQAIFKLGNILEEISKTGDLMPIENSQLLDEVSSLYLKAMASNLTLSDGVSHVLNTLIPALHTIQLEKSAQVRMQLFSEEFIKFKLLFLTKLQLEKTIKEYAETHESSFGSKMFSPAIVKKLRAFLKSSNHDAFYLSKERMNELYTLLVAHSYDPDSAHKTESLLTELTKQLFLTNGFVQPYSFGMFKNTSFLNIDAATTLLCSQNDDRQKIAHFINGLNSKGFLTSELFNALISVLKSSPDCINKIVFIVNAIQHLDLDTKNEMLGNFFEFALKKIPHSIADNTFIAYFSRFSDLYRDKRANIEQNIPKIVQMIEIFSLFNEATLAINMIEPTLKLVRETETTLGNDEFVACLSRISQNTLYRPHFIAILNWILLLPTPESRAELYRLMDQSVAWEPLKEAMDLVLLKAHQAKFPERPLDDVIAEFQTVQGDVEFPIDPDELQMLKKCYERIKNIGDELIAGGKVAVDKKPHEGFNIQDEEALRRLALIRHQIKTTFNIYPYNVQMINLLALLNNPRRIAQIKTGEGKSTLIAMLAAFYGMNSQKVDIITTARDLATRDAKKFTPFYRKLGLSVGDNAKDDSDSNDYLPDIVYGTNFDFEFAYLRGETQSESAGRGTRPYRVAIADEVDSMFIDMMRNEAILSSAESLYEPQIYANIWRWINTTPPRDQTSENLQEMLKASSSLEITLEQATTWIKSALSARDKMKEKQDYVIVPEADKKKGSKEIEIKIEIIDYKNTGQRNTNSRWQDGLHSFLEAKHQAQGVKIRKESLTNAAINHIEYFNKYSILIGLTGTLGSKSCRTELESLYKVDTYDSPTYRPSLKKPIQHIIATDQKLQNEAVLKEVKNMAALNRPSLILCETIAETEELFALFKKRHPSLSVQLYNGMQQENSETIIALAGHPGAITIATNMAGRGTDIVVSPEAEKQGGLHVIMTFPGSNSRVEQQAFGRTGRQGRQGTYHYILREDQFTAAELACDSLEDRMRTKAANRELFSEWRSYRNLLSYNFMHKEFLLQCIFFALPMDIKHEVMPHWARLKTEMQKDFRIVAQGQDDQDEYEEKAFLSIYTKFILFWNQYVRPFSADLYNSPLSFVADKEMSEAMTLCAQYMNVEMGRELEINHVEQPSIAALPTFFNGEVKGSNSRLSSHVANENQYEDVKDKTGDSSLREKLLTSVPF